MSKKSKKQPQVVQIQKKDEPAQIENKAPNVWMSFDQCWSECVKNGTPVLKIQAEAHLKSMGWLDQPDKWLDGLKSFGIPVEK